MLFEHSDEEVIKALNSMIMDYYSGKGNLSCTELIKSLYSEVTDEARDKRNLCIAYCSFCGLGNDLPFEDLYAKF